VVVPVAVTVKKEGDREVETQVRLAVHQLVVLEPVLCVRVCMCLCVYTHTHTLCVCVCMYMYVCIYT
jgi:hypothetical protein